MSRKPVCQFNRVGFQWRISAQWLFLVYHNLVTSVLHPVSYRALQHHEVMHHKPCVISGYGNISQALHIDHGFVVSQPGNFSLNGSLKLASMRKSAVKQPTVSNHPTLNKHTKRIRDFIGKKPRSTAKIKVTKVLIPTSWKTLIIFNFLH